LDYWFKKKLNTKNLSFSWKEDSSVPIGWSLRFLRELRSLRFLRCLRSLRCMRCVALDGNPALLRVIVADSQSNAYVNVNVNIEFI